MFICRATISLQSLPTIPHFLPRPPSLLAIPLSATFLYAAVESSISASLWFHLPLRPSIHHHLLSLSLTVSSLPITSHSFFPLLPRPSPLFFFAPDRSALITLMALMIQLNAALSPQCLTQASLCSWSEQWQQLGFFISVAARITWHLLLIPLTSSYDRTGHRHNFVPTTALFHQDTPGIKVAKVRRRNKECEAVDNAQVLVMVEWRCLDTSKAPDPLCCYRCCLLSWFNYLYPSICVSLCEDVFEKRSCLSAW